jgi:signal transduction histidine kinase
VALAWRATVRLAEARGRERTLEIEARHLRDLGQAAAGLAHETRNPLGLIRGWTQRMAESGADSCDGRQQARAVMEECDRLTARINQFLAFARPSDPKLERFDPAGVIDELAVLLEPDLSAKQVTLSRMAAGMTILADREMLRQALFNLLQNAVQACPEKACVETAAVRAREGQVRIEVRDRGPGVPGDDVEKLFTPYFTTRVGGTGLGLAIVRRIAAAHGWGVGYAPRPGGGATFWLDRIHG